MPKRKSNPRQMSFHFTDEKELVHLRDQINQLKAEIDQLKSQNAMLVAENYRLRDKLGNSQVEQTAEVTSFNEEMVTKQSSIESKIKLYRHYFKGREDVYAVRTTKQIGKSVYFPKRKYLGKENGKHIWGENLPLTDEVIRDHLQKENPPVTVGIYPLLLDETCWFLAIDFDKATWQDDARAFLETCQEFAVPASLERSRSGNGGHVWIFFEEPVPAKTARKMGSVLLTMTLEKRNQLGLDSYDRMFPNQDTLPREKKLGNLIALPLQRLPGKEGNSLFVDDNMEPYKDQWIFLSSIRKMKIFEVEEVVQKANRKGDEMRIINPLIYEEDEPWNKPTTPRIFEITGKIPSIINAVISDKIYIEKVGLSPLLMNFFIRMGAFQNPEFYRKQKMRLNTSNIPRIIDCTEDYGRYLALPRGCLDEMKELLESHSIQLQLRDERYTGTNVDIDFRGELREKQKEAVHQLEQFDTGTLSATTAFGKTVVGIWMIAARKTNTLILVNRKQLMEQWRSQIADFLNIPLTEVGQIGAGKNKRTGKIDVAMLQTVQGKGEVKDYISEYGHVVVDECHHISAFSFEKVLKKAKAKFVLGLTATLTRKDGHHPIVLMQCGPVRYRVDAKSEAESRPFDHIVIPRLTPFRLAEGSTEMPIQEIYNRIIADEQRNNLIFDDLLKALDEGRSPILLTDRTSHLEYFERRLQGFAKNIIVMRGGLGKKQWKLVQEKIQSIPDDQERVMLATGKFAGEGFDDARLDTLFLVMPISWKGTLHQYAGRLHRIHHAKCEVQIYDYVDEHVPILKRMYSKRCKGYSSLGYTIQGSNKNR